jgi:formate dehydrogenase maturation protein FdhE
MSEHPEAEDEAFAEAALLQAIENQIEAGEPPAALAVLNKLTLVGFEREEILQMMALVLAHEVKAMLAADRPFDGAAYEQALRALPELPDDPSEPA